MCFLNFFTHSVKIYDDPLLLHEDTATAIAKAAVDAHFIRERLQQSKNVRYHESRRISS